MLCTLGSCASELVRVACVSKVSDQKHIKILTQKQTLQRLTIALEQVKVGNISEEILNEIRKNLYSLYWAKEITEKLCINKMNSIKL